MDNRKLKPLGILLLFLASSAGYAQQAYVASGGDAEGKGGSVSFSVGIISLASMGTAIPLTQVGVQHPYELFVTEVNEIVNSAISAFPNPVTNELILQITDFKGENLLYQLYDIQGRLVESRQITADQTKINTTNLLSSVYFLKVIQENKQVQSFKILKN